MSGPEKRLQDQCLAWLKDHGVYHMNTHGNSYERRGRPDILICYSGRFVGLELKKGVGSTPTPIQLKHLDEIRKNGGIGEWITTVEEMIEILERIPNEKAR